jgi:hypothetical protein
MNIVQKKPLSTPEYEMILRGGRWGTGGGEFSATGPVGTDALLYRVGIAFMHSEGSGVRTARPGLRYGRGQWASRVQAGLLRIPTSGPDLETLRRYESPAANEVGALKRIGIDVVERVPCELLPANRLRNT